MVGGQDLYRKGRTLLKAHRIRQRYDLLCRHQRIFCIGFYADSRHAIACFDAFDTLANGLNNPRGFQPWNVRKFGLHDVFALAEKRIREVNANGVILNQHLAWSNLRGGRLA